MKTDDKKREFILSYLETQLNQVNLKTVRQLIEFGKNNDYSAPDLLNELTIMDQKHERILTATFVLDFVDGVNLFNNKATSWLTAKGQKYLQSLKLKESQSIHSNFAPRKASGSETAYDGYLTQLIACKNKMQTEADKVTLQEFTIDLRHLLTDSKKLEEGALSKFQPFVERNYRDLSTPMTPILVELSRRFLFSRKYDA
ncbi:hypothetical protein [Lentilactobacillus diolivorans]|uniref:Uncharacterized protein n=2 Tax=Lentilactobacillus diolivorans TaxID=179838 RepID=A0A0R1S8B7_9LACO|nr:hypothetical protein [Lentilactobacillus diolivorans]KRL65105.1 hypothetical protein FC85_GL000463 [Lentilactobacillus diolivorans DSM 14421]GEP24647.1 hypothetical protein LDI01_22400 [Lentilactobacillus diolivorans]